MLLYVSKQFTATASGSTLRAVRCERCSQEYFFELARVGVGRATAPYFLNQGGADRRAKKGAEKDLAKRLSQDQEAVPCPACGWIQDAMVRSIRQQKYRGLLNLVGWGLPAVLAILLIAGLFTWFDRYAKHGQLIPIFEMAAGAITLGVAMLALRSLLLSRIDPNQRYPEHPAVAPGTPPALLRETTNGVERFVPATIEPAVQSDDWVEVQFQRCVLPPVCCQCLQPPQHLFQTPLADNSHVPVPMCRACYRGMVWRWWGWTLVSIAIGLAVAAAIILSMHKGDAFGRWFLFGLIALFGSILTIAVLPRSMVMPYRMKTVDSSRGVVRIKFRNPLYTRQLIEIYQARSEIHLSNSADPDKTAAPSN